ncbi:MAG TPA: rod shape-determining protein MreC [Thiobacillus sp.]|nr:MAG: rod shape-determining protein MreC [Hydrogenophilales bacterium 28-61-11]OYZ58893.1 MAG: rod shape-determining protein MreC [Hydrogenophilales bacterium 16-61-112]OZA46991.1 MAG: rod shape-determining protein MreC [Hydrogenophilales bacterium 17-61-76]HQT30419.1 rod shape-determining protein MreC [Thiobacillus sp.]HQT68969.1 rod shape-determining protein MreC [Thiobacillus sp.]
MATSNQLMFARQLGATARLLIWLLVGLACVIADSRYHALEGLRSGFSLLLQPVRETLRVPADVATELGGFFTRHRLLQNERDALRIERASLLASVHAGREISRENAELRALLKLQTRPGQQLVHAAMLYRGHDWFAQQLVLDQGGRAKLRPGLPVVDASGLVGQLSQVYASSSEVTLVSSPNQLTPVFIERTGQRGLVEGSGRGVLELKYMPGNADVRVNDRLMTSGIDRVYPAGIPVARVTRVTHSQSGPYLRVACAPLAGLDRARAVLVLRADPPVVQTPLPPKDKKP